MFFGSGVVLSYSYPRAPAATIALGVAITACCGVTLCLLEKIEEISRKEKELKKNS